MNKKKKIERNRGRLEAMVSFDFRAINLTLPFHSSLSPSLLEGPPCLADSTLSCRAAYSYGFVDVSCKTSRE